MTQIERMVRENTGVVAAAPPIQQPDVSAQTQPDQTPILPLSGQNQPTATGNEPVTKWRLGNNSWAVLNLIVGDAKTLTECQQRIDAFMRLPLSINMPDFVRHAIEGMGFNVPDNNEQQVGSASGDNQLLPNGLQQQLAAQQQPQPPAPSQPSQQPQPAPIQQPVREAMGKLLTDGPQTVSRPDQGQWVSMDHAGIPLKVFISPGGTITKGPAALIGANTAHLPPMPGERHLTFHPPGHIPPLADASFSYAEHPEGSLPLKLTRDQSQKALIQAVHDVGTQANQARSGQAERLNAAMAEQVVRQGSTSAPGAGNDMADPRVSQGGAPLPPPWSGAEGADNPEAGAGGHGGQDLPGGLDGAKDSMDGAGTTDLVGGGGAGPLDDDDEDFAGGQGQGQDDDGVPNTHRMHAYLMDHVLQGQPQLEAVGRFSQPNVVEDKLAEARTPPEQILALAQHMHLWHPAEGAPDEKVGALGATVGQALDRAHRGGAIGPEDRQEYQGAMDHLSDFVGDHGRWPSSLEYAARANSRRRVPQPGQESQQEGEGPTNEPL